jgi:hypothetical protein
MESILAGVVTKTSFREQNDIKNFRYTGYVTCNIWIVTINHTKCGHSYRIAQNAIG